MWPKDRQLTQAEADAYLASKDPGGMLIDATKPPPMPAPTRGSAPPPGTPTVDKPAFAEEAAREYQENRLKQGGGMPEGSWDGVPAPGEYEDLTRSFAVTCKRADAERRRLRTLKTTPLRGAPKDTPQVTVEAVVYDLSTTGLEALLEPNCQRRLRELSPQQLRDVLRRLVGLRPRHPKINDALLTRIAAGRQRKLRS